VSDNGTSKVPEKFLVPVTEIALHLGVSLDAVRRWTDAGRKNGFPKVAEYMGPVKFYDIRQVEHWFALYSKTTWGKQRINPSGMGNGHIEHGGTDSGP